MVKCLPHRWVIDTFDRLILHVFAVLQSPAFASPSLAPFDHTSSGPESNTSDVETRSTGLNGVQRIIVNASVKHDLDQYNAKVVITSLPSALQ